MGSPITEYERVAVDRLKEAGHRITMPRLQVIRVLADSSRALSAQDIHARVSETGGRMDVVSVYRTLSTLSEAHLVHHVGAVDGYLACAVGGQHDGAVKHAICRRCGLVEEMAVTSSEQTLALDPLSDRGWTPGDLTIEVLGICPTCR